MIAGEIHNIDYIIIILYFIGILLFGTLFGKGTKTTKDFFFAGQRFSWWLIAFSMIATTVGSYSFVKYSQVAYLYGFSSTMTYLNDWIWMPLFLFVWLPIIYYNRITSIPEYLELRFDRKVRGFATIIILLYLIGYVGINLYSMGIVLKSLLGWNILFSATIVAVVCGIYVTSGGQTSVIMTDLVQGIILLIAGFIVLFIGFDFLGGAEHFWSLLPPSFKRGLAHFNTPSDFNFVGVFYQDGLANGIAVYFFNQGMVMRFLSAKSEKEARKAVSVVILFLMPITAIAVSNTGWIGKAMVYAGLLPDSVQAEEIFAIVINRLCPIGLFGFIMAALTAALMSTIDTLINAISALWVNDVVKIYIKKGAEDRYYLRMARYSAIFASLFGLLLVPVFASFKSIYSAHGAFTAAVTPPIGIAIIFAILSKRFSSKGALLVLIGGVIGIVSSFFIPEMIKPFSAGTPYRGDILAPISIRFISLLIFIVILVSLILSITTIVMKSRVNRIVIPVAIFFVSFPLYLFINMKVDAPLFDYKAYFFMRACFGLIISSGFGLISLFIFKKEEKDITGLVVGTIESLKKIYKGGEINYRRSKKVTLKVVIDRTGKAKDEIKLPYGSLERLNVDRGDILHISHSFWLYAGFRSFQARAGDTIKDEGVVLIPPHLMEEGRFKEGDKVIVEKIM